MANQLARILIQYRIIFLLLSILWMVISAIGLSKIAFETDFRIFISETNPKLIAWDKVEEDFYQTERIFFFIIPKDESVFNNTTLSLVRDLTERAWQTPYSIAVNSLSNALHTQVKADDFITDYLLPQEVARGVPYSLSQQQLNNIETLTLAEDEFVNGIVSPKGDSTLISISLALPGSEHQSYAYELDDFAQAQISWAEQRYPNHEIYYLGWMRNMKAELEILLDDARTVLPLVALVGWVILLLFVRSLACVVSGMLLIVTTQLVTLGIPSLLGTPFNGTAIIAPLMVLLLSAADAAHLLTQYVQHLRLGKDRVSAMQASLSFNMLPIFLTTVTTVCGFLGLNFADSPAIQLLGNVAALGVFAAWVFTLALLPSVVLWLPHNPPNRPLPLTEFMGWLARFVVKNRTPLLIVNSVVIATSIAFIPSNEVDDDYSKYFHESTDIRQAYEAFESKFNTGREIIYIFDAGEENGVNDPEFLRNVDRFLQFVRSREFVSYAHTYVDTLKTLNRRMHQDNEDWEVVPDTQELASQYMMLYEFSLPQGEDSTRDLKIDRSALRVNIALAPMSTQQYLASERIIQSWLDKNLPQYKTEGTGLNVIFSNHNIDTIKNLILGAFVALTVITLILFFGLRSLRYGLISMIPNLFPAVVIFGLWGALVGEVNFFVAAIFSISIGIVVDDSVHFLTKYILKIKEGASPAEAIEYSFTTSGTALVITTVSFSVGMLFALTSNWLPVSRVATFMAPILVTALILDFLLLPPVLMWLDRHKNSPGSKQEIERAESSDSSSTKVA